MSHKKETAMQVTEARIAKDLRQAGEDPNDPLARALYLEALAATKPSPPQPKGDTLISQITAASHLSHSQLGEMIGVSRATVQAYGSGRIPENYGSEELALFRARLEAQLADMHAVVKRIARMQADILN